jgi:hypothetical protein
MTAEIALSCSTFISSVASTFRTQQILLGQDFPHRRRDRAFYRRNLCAVSQLLRHHNSLLGRALSERRPAFWMERLCYACKSNKKWTPEVDKRLLDLQAVGKSTFVIAAELRRSITSVRGRLSLLKAKGRLASSSEAILSTPRRKRWTLDDDQRLMDLRAKGASFNEIAIAVGRTEAALEQRAHNLKPPSCVALSRRRTETEPLRAIAF